MSASSHTRTVLAWTFAAIGWLLALLLALLLLAKQGDCNRSDDDGGDDGMEPACKPGDQTCHGGQVLTTEPLPDLREGAPK